MKKIIICVMMTVLLTGNAWAVDCLQLKTKQDVIDQLDPNNAVRLATN